ncbi:MAG: PBECR2 nuclease fold domain-containing protein [Clostridium sp.]|nr:PBECR2 nuclease fold domain-containing protein [Clostridium sp.]
MHLVGKIDKDIYKCITDNIVTDEVIITDERIAHIKERHPKDYKTVIQYMKKALQRPDYILKDERINTGLIIKSIQQDHVQVVLRIHTSKDEMGYKNSIISCWKISERRLQNYLRNKEILYKKE